MRILILGASGMWGHQVYLTLAQHFSKLESSKFSDIVVAGTFRHSMSSYQRLDSVLRNSLASNFYKVYENVDWLHFKDAEEKALQNFKPDLIINCVGLTPRKYDIQNVEHYLEINSHLPQKLAQWCGSQSSRLIHFSTDCVFSGKKGNYTESDLPDAMDIYGRSKALGEIRAENVLTFRLSKIGREIYRKTEIIEWFLSQENKKVYGFSKALYSGVTTYFMANELIRLITDFPNLSGLYQVSGPSISKFRLLELLNETYGKQISIENKENYVLDKTLKSDLYTRTTGYKEKSWNLMLHEMKANEFPLYD